MEHLCVSGKLAKTENQTAVYAWMPDRRYRKRPIAPCKQTGSARFWTRKLLGWDILVCRGFFFKLFSLNHSIYFGFITPWSRHVTHHNQAHFALLVGPVGSQNGNHHGHRANDVQGDEAAGAIWQLQGGRTGDWQVSVCVWVLFSCKSAWVCSYIISTMSAGDDLRQQRQPQDDSAHNLKRTHTKIHRI